MAVPTILTSGSFVQSLFGTNLNQAVNSGTTGSDRMLVVGVSFDSNGTGGNVSTMSYDGSSMTEAVAIAQSNGDNPAVELWYIAAPSTGSNTLNITFNIESAGVHIQFWVLTGAAQTGQPDVSGSYNNAAVAASVAMTTGEVGMMLGIAAGLKGGTFASWAPQGGTTEDSDTSTPDFSISSGVHESAATTGSNTIATSANATVAGQTYAMVAANFAEVGGSTVVLGQASETDTGQSASSAKDRAVGQATETDTGLAAEPAFVVAVGQASETDSGQSAIPSKALGVGQAIETDTGLPVSAPTTVLLGQASETDSGQAAAPTKTVVLGQASESSTGQSSSSSKQRDVGQSLETDTALALDSGVTVPVGQAFESDDALGAVSSKQFLLGQAFESDEAVSVIGQEQIGRRQAWTEVATTPSQTPSYAIAGGIPQPALVIVTANGGAVLRTVTGVSWGGQSLTLVDQEATTSGRDFHSSMWILDEAGINAAVGTTIVTSTDSAGAVQFRMYAAVYENVNQGDLVADNFSVNASGGATPTPEALTSDDGGMAIVFASCNVGTDEVDDPAITFNNLTEQAGAALSSTTTEVGDATTDGTDFTPDLTYTDTNVGHMIGATLRLGKTTRLVGQASEVDSGLPVNPSVVVGMGQATEADTATALVSGDVVLLGQASETDTAPTLVPVGVVALGQATETDTALGATPSKTVDVGQASETDSALAIAATPRVVPVGQAVETDTAPAIASDEFGQAQRDLAGTGIDLDIDDLESVQFHEGPTLQEQDDMDLEVIVPAFAKTLVRFLR